VIKTSLEATKFLPSYQLLAYVNQPETHVVTEDYYYYQYLCEQNDKTVGKFGGDKLERKVRVQVKSEGGPAS
jgi:hypothetical protein